MALWPTHVHAYMFVHPYTLISSCVILLCAPKTEGPVFIFPMCGGMRLNSLRLRPPTPNVQATNARWDVIFTWGPFITNWARRMYCICLVGSMFSFGQRGAHFVRKQNSACWARVPIKCNDITKTITKPKSQINRTCKHTPCTTRNSPTANCCKIVMDQQPITCNTSSRTTHTRTSAIIHCNLTRCTCVRVYTHVHRY